MRIRLVLTAVSVAVVLLMSACRKDTSPPNLPAAPEQREQMLARAAEAMSRGKPQEAISLLKRESAKTPNDAVFLVALAEAYFADGNPSAALLSLRQSEKSPNAPDATLRKRRADTYMRLRQPKEAKADFTALRDAGLLTEKELGVLARLQLHAQELDEVDETVKRIREQSAQSVLAAVIDAELMWQRGDEIVAARRMDTLVSEHPEEPEARLLRIRYFLAKGRHDLAEQDLALIAPATMRDPSIAALKVQQLISVKRLDEALGVLKRAMEGAPSNGDLMAQMALVQLYRKEPADASRLVVEALLWDPKNPMAFAVRGKIKQEAGDELGALDDYKAALQVDLHCALALSSVVPVMLKKGNTAEAQAALERLAEAHAATRDERVKLTELYVDQRKLKEARKLIDSGLEDDPKDADFVRLKKRIASIVDSQGVPVIRGR